MSRSDARTVLGRRLRLALVGGGGGALIGPVHRMAARLDDQIEIVAGVMSSDPDRSMAQAAALGIPRAYPDVATMIAAEGARSDGADAVSISTPNDTHVAFAGLALDAGLDVICDKPIANDFASAMAMAEKIRDSGLVVVLTHNYAGYPMVREARSAVQAGEIGALRIVKVTYFQGSLATRVEDDPGSMPDRLKWRLDPARGGVSHVMGDIGTHAHQLHTFETGEPDAAVAAQLGAAVPGRSADDTGAALIRMAGGAMGVLFVTKAANGAENALAIEVYGERGGLGWEQRDANTLRVMRHNRPVELRTRALPTLHPAALRASRLPPGHPEAFIEGFANLYRDFADMVAARRMGVPPDPLATDAPGIADGIAGLAFIDACLASTRTGRWVTISGAKA